MFLYRRTYIHTCIHTYKYTKEKMNDRSWGGWIRIRMKIENKKQNKKTRGRKSSLSPCIMAN